MKRIRWKPPPPTTTLNRQSEIQTPDDSKKTESKAIDL